jgi:multidrug resistance efflux pump
MPLSKQKTYARFNVGKYMKQAKTARNNLSECNENIRKEKLKYEAAKAKLKRLQLKVNDLESLDTMHIFFNVYCLYGFLL